MWQNKGLPCSTHSRALNKPNQRTQFQHLQFRVSLKGLKTDFVSYRTSSLSPQCFHKPVLITRKPQHYEIFMLGFRLTQLQHKTPKRDKKNRLEGIHYIVLWPLETNFRYSTGSGYKQGISRVQNCVLKNIYHLMCKAGLQITTLRLKIRIWIVNASRDRWQ